MRGLDSLFEEDIEMQDAIEDMDSIVSDDEDLLIGVIEDRFKTESTNTNHLFTDEDYRAFKEECELENDVDDLLSDKYDKHELSDEDLDELFDEDLDSDF